MSQEELFPLGSRVAVISQDWEGKVVGYTEDGFALIDLGDFGVRFFRDVTQLRAQAVAVDGDKPCVHDFAATDDVFDYCIHCPEKRPAVRRNETEPFRLSDKS